jgi:3-phosphoshikimate 1-carboxyvinyltransferase
MRRVQEVDVRTRAPPSKSFTHRAYLAAALAQGESRIRSPLRAGDTDRTCAALRQMGIPSTWADTDLRIPGCDGTLHCAQDAVVDLGNSGTSIRLLAAAAMLCDHPLTLTGDARMRERPIGPLAETLGALGGKVEFLQRTGYPPVRVQGPLRGGAVTIDASASSQFVSAVLMAAPYAREVVDLSVAAPPVSRSYIDITREVMERFGAKVIRDGYTHFVVDNHFRYQGREYPIEGDYSSAAFFFAIAAVCGGRVTVENLVPESVQGDRAFLDCLAAMGCRVLPGGNAVAVERDAPLQGITVDMTNAPDTVQPLCMVAATAQTPTTITGTAHLRFKESDRVEVTAGQLRRMGAGVEIGNSWIRITPHPLRPVRIDPAGDHRTAMSFAVLGLGVGDVVIQDAECVQKSFPSFWEELHRGGLL